MKLLRTEENIRKAKLEMWYRGNLRYKLHAGQKKVDDLFRSSTKQLFVGNISRQFGKSFWAVTKAIECALKIPKAQIRFATAFQTDLETFIQPAFRKILEDCPKDLEPTFKTNGSKWVFKNGAEIKLVGVDKHPNSLRGSTLDLIIIDECGFVSNLDYIYKSVIIPSTMHRPQAKVILISTPPATPAHAFIDYCQKAELECGYVKLTIYDNPMINEATIKRLIEESGGEDSTTWRREYLGEFITDSDLAIIPEWKDDFIQDVETDMTYVYHHKYVGLDLGVKDFTAAIFGYYDFRKATLIIEDEFRMNGPSMNTEILVGAIRKTEAELWGENPPFRRVSDNNWPILMQDFSSIHNLTFIATTKDNLEAMINEVRLMVQKGQIVIHPRCKSLIGCMKYGVWDSKKRGFARSSAFGHFDHLAALIYLVRNLAKHSNPIPAVLNPTFQTFSGVGVTSKQSANAKAISSMLSPKRKGIGRH